MIKFIGKKSITSIVRLGENKVFVQCIKNRKCLTAGVHQLKEWRDTTDADSAIDYNGTDLVLTGDTSSLWTCYF